MSWMDSWSRPSKHQATPAPLYLLPGGEATPYCHSCGRVIGARRTTAASQDKSANATPVKYCSSRCRSHKPGKTDTDIERVFVKFLSGYGEAASEDEGRSSNAAKERPLKASGKDVRRAGKKPKGDARILVSCSMVEHAVFGHRDTESDSDITHSSRNGEEDGYEASGDLRRTTQGSYDAGPSTGSLEDPTADAEPYVDGDRLARMSVRSGTRIRPPQSVSEVNGSVGGEKGRAERVEETDEMLEKRRRGQRRAKEREMVRCAARRGVIFGFLDDMEHEPGEVKKSNPKNQAESRKGERKKCEAVMLGKVVEPSFAKGDWSIRWRA